MSNLVYLTYTYDPNRTISGKSRLEINSKGEVTTHSRAKKKTEFSLLDEILCHFQDTIKL